MAADYIETQPTAPTPLSRWQGSAINQRELTAFLASPTGQDLINVLRYLAAPQSPIPPGFQGEEPIASRALQFSELVGYHNALNNIQALTTPSSGVAALPKPWQGSRLSDQLEQQH